MATVMEPKAERGDQLTTADGKLHGKAERVIFNPASGRLPPPATTAEYAAIDPTYPDFLKGIFADELRRNYQYQLVALVAGWSFGALLVAGAIFLVYTNHPKMAGVLIGGNVLGLATRMLTKGATRSN